MGAEKAVAQGVMAVGGAVTGVVTGMKGAAVPQMVSSLRGPGSGVLKASAKASNATTQALRNHQGWSKAIGAGVAAVAGHGVIAGAAVAAAPVLVVGAVVGTAAFGIWKLLKD